MAVSSMIPGALALVTGALFTGAAIYISIAEQPARLALDPKAMLAEWKPAYAAGFAMQASLAFASALFGLLMFYTTRDWRWMTGAALIFANWPFTVLVMLPVNKRLEAIAPEAADAETRHLIERWGMFHAVRSAFGVAATAIYLWALV
jgi:Domain of unknown function (DUF1772)